MGSRYSDKYIEKNVVILSFSLQQLRTSNNDNISRCKHREGFSKCHPIKTDVRNIDENGSFFKKVQAKFLNLSPWIWSCSLRNVSCWPENWDFLSYAPPVVFSFGVVAMQVGRQGV